MRGIGLVLNKSYDDFILGNNIIEYDSKPHQIHMHDAQCPWDCYSFIQNGIVIEVWCENNLIKNICCNQSCIYNGQELINMNYLEFLQIINEVPVSHEVIYVLVNTNHGQNQHVYDFEKSGLQIWVWRNKIRTVIISKSNDDERESQELDSTNIKER